ncbi:N-6 DNA methylase [Psittacicella hinzii]|uniref:DNA methylase adenine-specific domain-containing protein n=1 Tax=Psittacicella hinzii TaxID=2028575 RepID=A0A3A1YRJ9_9GAMM|nr:N-6 DNA methylase [Psittacicella hinzii]RIY40822.1 hypothetical protein CKF58_00040 [Psittacicella hinzii]
MTYPYTTLPLNYVSPKLEQLVTDLVGTLPTLISNGNACFAVELQHELTDNQATNSHSYIKLDPNSQNTSCNSQAPQYLQLNIATFKQQKHLLLAVLASDYLLTLGCLYREVMQEKREENQHSVSKSHETLLSTANSIPTDKLLTPLELFNTYVTEVQALHPYYPAPNFKNLDNPLKLLAYLQVITGINFAKLQAFIEQQIAMQKIVICTIDQAKDNYQDNSKDYSLDSNDYVFEDDSISQTKCLFTNSSVVLGSGNCFVVKGGLEVYRALSESLPEIYDLRDYDTTYLGELSKFWLEYSLEVDRQSNSDFLETESSGYRDFNAANSSAVEFYDKFVTERNALAKHNALTEHNTLEVDCITTIKLNSLTEASVTNGSVASASVTNASVASSAVVSSDVVSSDVADSAVISTTLITFNQWLEQIEQSILLPLRQYVLSYYHLFSLNSSNYHNDDLTHFADRNLDSKTNGKYSSENFAKDIDPLYLPDPLVAYGLMFDKVMAELCLLEGENGGEYYVPAWLVSCLQQTVSTAIQARAKQTTSEQFTAVQTTIEQGAVVQTTAKQAIAVQTKNEQVTASQTTTQQTTANLDPIEVSLSEQDFNNIHYDPFMGSGDILLGDYHQYLTQVLQQAEESSNSSSNAGYSVPIPQYYGKELFTYTWEIAQFNYLVHNLNVNTGLSANSFKAADATFKGKVMHMACNPPFDLEDWADEEILNRKWLITPVSNSSANFAWGQLHLEYLQAQGNSALLLSQNTLNPPAQEQAKQQRAFIQAGVVQAIITLPSKLSTNVAAPICLWQLQGREFAPLSLVE